MQPWFTVYFDIVLDIHVWSIDTCQSMVSADPYHVTVSWAQAYSSSRSRVFLKLTADNWLDRGLMSDLLENRARLFGRPLVLTHD